MALNLPQATFELLKSQPDSKFTVRQIAEWIFNQYPDECRLKQERSKATKYPLVTDNALIQQIAAEVSSQRPSIQKKYPQIKTTEGRPRKYYYDSIRNDIAELSAEEIVIDIDNKSNSFPNDKRSISEPDLYAKLSEYLFVELSVHTKRINEKRSKNNRGPKGNIWLYPDIVGMEDLSKDWQSEVKDCVRVYSDKKTKLWSFEVKLEITRSNIREYFFQTVSNSSWANFSYLVAAEIIGNDTLKELRILCGLHGIGFMKIDFNNPSESEILIPAKERNEIDWNTVNRLVEENTDFQEYIKLVKQFYQTGDARLKDWDYNQL